METPSLCHSRTHGHGIGSSLPEVLEVLPVNDKVINQFPKSNLSLSLCPHQLRNLPSAYMMLLQRQSHPGLCLKQRFGHTHSDADAATLTTKCVASNYSNSNSGFLAELERELEAEIFMKAEEWMRMGRLGERCKERKGMVELLECLETEAIMGEDQGREPTDYNRRAQIFDKSSRVFQALKALTRTQSSNHSQPS